MHDDNTARRQLVADTHCLNRHHLPDRQLTQRRRQAVGRHRGAGVVMQLDAVDTYAGKTRDQPHNAGAPNATFRRAGAANARPSGQGWWQWFVRPCRCARAADATAHGHWILRRCHRATGVFRIGSGQGQRPDRDRAADDPAQDAACHGISCGKHGELPAVRFNGDRRGPWVQHKNKCQRSCAGAAQCSGRRPFPVSWRFC